MDIPVIWASPLSDCQLCAGDFSGTMYDAAIPPAGGRWGNVCHACFTRTGGQLGVGHGQRYELQTRGKTRAWFKTGG